jgi:RNA polymerase sigma factor (sigma-70 family)
VERSYLDIETADEANASLPVVTDEAVLLSSMERPALFGVLVDRYQASFLRVANRIVRERTEAEDVVQDAFVKIYRHAKNFQKGEDRKFSSWAYKIVVNTAITHYHKQKRREWQMPDPETGIDPTADEARVQFKEAVLARETEELVRAVLETMPEDLKKLLTAYYLEDKSYETIAKHEGITTGALKMKLFRARRAFKRMLPNSTD